MDFSSWVNVFMSGVVVYQVIAMIRMRRRYEDRLRILEYQNDYARHIVDVLAGGNPNG